MGSINFDVAQQTIVVSSVFTLLASLSLSFHITVRLSLLKTRLGFDDWLTVMAFLISLVLVAQTIWAVRGEGQGQHVTSIIYTQFEMMAKSLLIHEELWALTNSLIRLSASITIKKIFGAIDRYRIWSNVVMALSIIHGLSTILIGALVCRPLNAAWDPNVEGICINQTTTFVAIEAAGLALDLLILAVPFLAVPQLHMRRRLKCAAIFVLSAGVSVAIFTGLRIGALHSVNSFNVTYDQAYLGLLSTVGALTGIIAACFPSFAAGYRHMDSRRKDKTNVMVSKCTLEPVSKRSIESGHTEFSFDITSPDVENGDTSLEIQKS
ncbi:hypothetical protein GGR58DRAFT_21294 [Xylaria digitata]|nr:hypothetical protein GGR58DRAFT_21294 [Xylaria digitata]